MQLTSSSSQVLMALLTAATISFAFHHLFAASNSEDTTFDELATHCSDISPISSSEFYERQKKLAQTLHSLNASAYIAEPGASALYYANLSGSSWHLSERPLLLLVSPRVADDGAISPNISILTPSFEATRAKLLPIPAKNVSWFEWPEEVDPYKIAVEALPPLGDGDKVFVDGGIRNFIVDGIQNAAPQSKVVTVPVELRRIRERKSPAELEILKCANEVTVLAIRAVRDRFYLGIKESQGKALIAQALTKAGLEGGSGLVLFGENAALPHGSGSDRALGPNDFALIDCGGSLHGYTSDVTRTFLLDKSAVSKRHLAIWDLVFAAQTQALESAGAGVIAHDVDKAARKVITMGGYGQYFTHRLGHGIGLEGHESPYLNGASTDVLLSGHSFSDEPGVYIEGSVFDWRIASSSTRMEVPYI